MCFLNVLTPSKPPRPHFGHTRICNGFAPPALPSAGLPAATKPAAATDLPITAWRLTLLIWSPPLPTLPL